MLGDETSVTNRPSRGRRRKLKEIPTGSDSEKENRSGTPGRQRAVKSTPSTIPVENHTRGFDDEFMAFATSLGDGPTISSSSSSFDETLYVEASHNFRQALRKVTISSSLWKEHPQLLEIVIRASLFRTADGYLFLDGHSSSLISLVRKLVKDATASVGAENGSGRLHNLFVAVHVLRAITFVLRKSCIERKESLLKLFYHLITTVSDTKRNADAIEGSMTLRAGLIALAGYEGLGQVLSTYSTQSKDGDQRIMRFELVRDKATDKRILFSVPSSNINQTRKVKDPTLGTLNARQLCTIALQTTSVVAHAIKSFMNPSITKDLQTFLPPCYGSLGWILAERLEGLNCVLIEILKGVNEPWLLFLAKSNPDEPDPAKEVVNYAKGAHRLLWDAASQLKTNSDGTKDMEVERLELRKTAIELLLPNTSVHNVDNLIRKSILDVACTYAWKAATVFAQNCSKGTSTNAGHEKHLSLFYRNMDSSLEKFVSADQPIPLGFVEFIANKYLQVPSESLGNIMSSELIDHRVSKGQETILSGDYRILLLTMLLGIFVKGRVEFHKAGESLSLVGDGERLLNCAKPVMRDFNEHITQQLDVLPPEIRNRIFKVMTSLMIQKTLYTALKQTAEDLSNMESTLVLGTKLLTDCLGPFAVCFSKFCTEKSHQIYDLIVECYIRPIGVFEQLSKQESLNSAEFLTLSDVACQKLYEILTEEKVSVQCVEKAAKVRDSEILRLYYYSGVLTRHLSTCLT
jgi:hypothetical protein